MANIFWCWLGIVTSKDLLSKRFWLQLSQILVEPWHHRPAWHKTIFWRIETVSNFFDDVHWTLSQSTWVPAFHFVQASSLHVKESSRLLKFKKIKVMSVFPWFRMGFVLTLICPKHPAVTNSFQSVKWRHFYVWIPRFYAPGIGISRLHWPTFSKKLPVLSRKMACCHLLSC